MPHHRPLPALAAVLAACALLLATAAVAAAQPYDNVPHRVVPRATPAPVVTETVVRVAHDGPNTPVIALAGIGTVLALLGAGYLGARIATRPRKLPAN
jgi:hypothetical protein